MYNIDLGNLTQDKNEKSIRKKLDEEIDSDIGDMGFGSSDEEEVVQEDFKKKQKILAEKEDERLKDE